MEIHEFLKKSKLPAPFSVRKRLEKSAESMHYQKMVQIQVVLEGKKNQNNCLVSDFYRILNFRALFSHGVNRGKFQKPVKTAHKEVVLIYFSL